MKVTGTKMEEYNFFKFLFHEKSNVPKKEVSSVFHKMFPKAKNAEWVQKNKHFEAIFYEGEIEKIAEFDKAGNCLLIKTNLNPTGFQGRLREIAEKFGEIMNVIKIEKDNSVQFEIIVRDLELTRYLLILDENGNEVKYEKL